MIRRSRRPSLPLRWPLLAVRSRRRRRRGRPAIRLASWLVVVGLLAGVGWLTVAGCRGPQAPTPPAAPGLAEVPLTAAPLPELTGEPLVRVRVAAGRRRVVLGGPAALWVEVEGQRRTYPAPLTIERLPGRFRLTPARGPAMDWNTPALSVRAEGAGAVSLGASAYPGLLWLHAAGGDQTLDVVNHVPMEQYLPGVLQGELYARWHPQTFRAAAIAARSYAVCEIHRARVLRRTYDLESTTASQVYQGGGAHARAVQAVRDTRAMVLVYDRQVVPAYYSSTCGGRSQDAAAAFPKAPPLPPLEGRAHPAWCQGSPHFRWGPVARPADELLRRMQAWGQRHRHPLGQLTTLASIDVAARTATGRPARFTVRDRTGRGVEVAAELLRFAANADAPGLAALPKPAQLKSSDVEAQVQSGQVIFTHGRGFGHGVGLCQWGAQGMAEAGHDALSILGTYYPGAGVVRAY